jgi:MYXO-CTERM domain-containing protein
VDRTPVRRFGFVLAGLALSSLCAAGVALEASGCSNAKAGTLHPTGALPVREGELVTYVADFWDGHSERSSALRLSDGRELKLAFDGAPETVNGSRVRVHGEALGDTIHVSTFETLSLPGPTPQITRDSPPSPDTYALVLVDLGGGVDVDAAAGAKAMFSTTPTDKSFASYYFESSFGKYVVNGAVLGPYQYSMTTCDTTGMYQALEAAQATAFAPYKHLIYYFSETTLCTFGGLGEEGSQSAPAKRTWMNGSLGCVVLMQEPGHNLGLMHANTIACGDAGFSTTPATSCTITEYGNSLTTMGGGCHQNNGYEKWYEQWLSGCNGVRVTAGGTFNLVPLGESCPGATQVLQIPMPAPRTVNDPQATTTTVNLRDYYVELRAAEGQFDGYTTRTGGGFGGGVTYKAPTVAVYVSDDVHTGVPARGSSGNSVWTELLNMTPGSTAFTGLTAAGQSYVDPAGGATITLESISATGAVVNVAVPDGTGTPTCIDGTTFTGPGSDCDGGAVTIPPFDAGVPPPADAAPTPEAGSPDAASAPDARVAGDAAESSDAPGTAPDADAAEHAPTEAGAGTDAQASIGTPPADTSSNSNASSGCGCVAAGASNGGAYGGWGAALVLAGVGWRSSRRRKAPGTRSRSTAGA